MALTPQGTVPPEEAKCPFPSSALHAASTPSSRKRPWLIGAALAATIVAGAATIYTATTIKPAIYPSHLNPTSTLQWGIPAADALKSDAFTACTGSTQQGTKDVAAYVEYWWGKQSRATEFYNCRGTSLHGEGRAFDYFVDKNVAEPEGEGRCDLRLLPQDGQRWSRPWRR